MPDFHFTTSTDLSTDTFVGTAVFTLAVKRTSTSALLKLCVSTY